MKEKTEPTKYKKKTWVEKRLDLNSVQTTLKKSTFEVK